MPRQRPWPVAVLAATVCGCDPTVVIGTLVHGDAEADGPGDAQTDAAADAQGDATLDGQGDGPSDGQADGQGCPGSSADASPVADPDASIGTWTTSFEDGFCGYASPTGFCYTAGPGSYSLVTSPVHSGKYAAAFSVQGVNDAGVGAGQARCVEQGVFPSAAYYGAWYYVPAGIVNGHTWNLFHYQGDADGGFRGLWDVSLVNTGGSSGPLHVVLFDFLNGMALDANGVPPFRSASGFTWRSISRGPTTPRA